MAQHVFGDLLDVFRDHVTTPTQEGDRTRARRELRQLLPVRTGEEEASLFRRVADADVTERIDDAEIGEDAIGDHQILDCARDSVHARL